AEVLYERDELADAYEHAARGIALCRQLGYTQPLATGLALLARIRWAQGDTAGALDTIGQAERVGLSPQVAALHNPVPAWRGPPPVAPRPARTPPPPAPPPPAAGREPPPGGPASGGCGPARSRATRGNVTTWRWRGCCSPNTPPARRSGSSTASTPRRRPSSGPAASSKRRRCERSRSRTAATSRPPRPARPKRRRWPPRRATYAASLPRVPPGPGCWAGSPRPSAPGGSCPPGRSRRAISTN